MDHTGSGRPVNTAYTSFGLAGAVQRSNSQGYTYCADVRLCAVEALPPAAPVGGLVLSGRVAAGGVWRQPPAQAPYRVITTTSGSYTKLEQCYVVVILSRPLPLAACITCTAAQLNTSEHSGAGDNGTGTTHANTRPSLTHILPPNTFPAYSPGRL